MTGSGQSRLERALERAHGLLEHSGETTIENLVPSSELGSMEARFIGGFSRDVSLDGLDVLAVGLAGAAAAAIDLLLVAIPRDVTYLGSHPQRGGFLTKTLNGWHVPAENEAARAARVPFDAVADPEKRVPGMFAGNHRFMTPGHDPLVGLLVGVHDILRGGRTAIGTDGILRFDAGFAEPTTSVVAALATEILHLVSDVATKAGLPAPLMSIAGLLRFGSFGARGRTVADLARYMYESGYDLRHFLATCSAPAGIRLLLSAYFLGRRYLDERYDAHALASAKRKTRTLDHPRLKTMIFLSDSIACAANAGKIALYAGNPCAFNYGQWLAFLRSSLAFLAMKLESPTEVLIDRATANEAVLRRRWEDIRQRTGIDLPDPSEAF